MVLIEAVEGIAHQQAAGSSRTVMSVNQLVSVADPDLNPDPDPSDPYVFGPPVSGSGSISQRYDLDPAPSIIKQK